MLGRKQQCYGPPTLIYSAVWDSRGRPEACSSKLTGAMSPVWTWWLREVGTGDWESQSLPGIQGGRADLEEQMMNMALGP